MIKLLVIFRKWILSSFVFCVLSGMIPALSEGLEFSGSSLPQRDRHVEARLLSDRSHINAGESWWVALELKHDPTWHTYWQNGGDAGMPTVIEWTLPRGITAGPIQWETPQIVKMGRLDVYGYEGTCLLLVQLESSADAVFNEPLEIKAFVNWMMCARTCVPGRGVNLDLRLGIDDTALSKRKTEWFKHIKNAASKFPPKAQTDAFKANLDIPSNRFDLQWENFPQSGELEDVYFFDITEQITSDKPQTLEQTEQGWKLSLSRAAYASAKPKRMHGWLRWKMAGEDFHWARLDLPIN
ncbi:MAG: hypothetical protein EVA71_01810 [Limisphaerales bacterium]|nr:MAG: hypothetical protein EVA71_01810 [Limisphaerales bacterium]